MTSADSFGLVVPISWVELPTDDDEFRRYATDVRRVIRTTDGWNRTLDRRIELFLSQLKNDVHASGTRMAAVLVEPTETATGLQVVLAGVTVSRVDKSALGVRVPLEVDVVLAAFGRQPTMNENVVHTNIEPPSKVTLPAGDAVRLRRLHTIKDNVVQSHSYYTESYLVPFDEEAALCAIQFMTPNVEDGSVVGELFEAMARTLRIFGPDDPTDFSEPSAGG